MVKCHNTFKLNNWLIINLQRLLKLFTTEAESSTSYTNLKLQSEHKSTQHFQTIQKLTLIYLDVLKSKIYWKNMWPHFSQWLINGRLSKLLNSHQNCGDFSCSCPRTTVCTMGGIGLCVWVFYLVYCKKGFIIYIFGFQGSITWSYVCQDLATKVCSCHIWLWFLFIGHWASELHVIHKIRSLLMGLNTMFRV